MNKKIICLTGTFAVKARSAFRCPPCYTFLQAKTTNMKNLIYRCFYFLAGLGPWISTRKAERCQKTWQESICLDEIVDAMNEPCTDAYRYSIYRQLLECLQDLKIPLSDDLEVTVFCDGVVLNFRSKTLSVDIDDLGVRYGVANSANFLMIHVVDQVSRDKVSDPSFWSGFRDWIMTQCLIHCSYK